jgi:hypothetical protein
MGGEDGAMKPEGSRPTTWERLAALFGTEITDPDPTGIGPDVEAVED